MYVSMAAIPTGRKYRSEIYGIYVVSLRNNFPYVER